MGLSYSLPRRIIGTCAAQLSGDNDAASEPSGVKEPVSAQGANHIQDTHMNLTASLSLCQYCEHANPADAKFCAGCGAPLHLIPCPHCGAVNQKSSKNCYQCHGELRENTEILLADAPASASETAAGNAESPPMPATYQSQAAVRQRQPVFVVGIILIAFAAAAYFAYQQRSVVAAKGASGGSIDPATAKPPGKIADPSPANSTAGAINKASPAVTTPTVENPAATTGKDGPANQLAPAIVVKQGKVGEPPDAPATANREPAGVAVKSSRRRAPAVIAAEPTPFASAPTRVPLGSAIQKQPPRTGVCTEGIAALGLCTPDPTKGRQ